VTTAKNA